jgi:hypothetical protein
LNRSDACRSGVWSVLPSWAAVKSASACLTRLTVLSATGGSAGIETGGDGTASDRADASAAVASATSRSAADTSSRAAATCSAAVITSDRGSVNSAPACFTSPTVGAVAVMRLP